MQSGTFTFIYTWVDQYVAGNSKVWPSFLSLEIGIAPSYTLNSNGRYSIMVSRKGWPYDAAIVSAIGGIIILYVGIFGLLVLFHTAHTSFDMLLEITGTVSGMLILVYQLPALFQQEKTCDLGDHYFCLFHTQLGRHLRRSFLWLRSCFPWRNNGNFLESGTNGYKKTGAGEGQLKNEFSCKQAS